MVGRRHRTTWESLVERLIREAAEDGAFDDLPYRGERIPIDDDGGEWALAHHVLRQAGMAPPWVETDREIRRLLEERDHLVARAARTAPADRPRDRERLARIVEVVNRLALRLELDAPTDRQQRRRPDLAQELARLEAVVNPVSGAGGSPPDRGSGDRPRP